MIGSKYGIAIIENFFSKNEVNPNVAIEFGFMRALKKEKDILLLKEKNANLNRADFLGRIRKEFNTTSKEIMKKTIVEAIDNWLAGKVPSKI